MICNSACVAAQDVAGKGLNLNSLLECDLVRNATKPGIAATTADKATQTPFIKELEELQTLQRHCGLS